MRHDDPVRQLWVDGFEFRADFPSETQFVRVSDGASVLVPKTEEVSEELARPRSAGFSPCCNAESHLRRVVGGLFLMRCSKCNSLWEKEIAKPRAHLRVV